MGLFDLFKNKSNNNENEEVENEDLSIYENEEFEMVIEDVFSISGRGTVVTGHVDSGIIYVGDTIYINGENEAEVVGLEMFRKMLNCAHRGDNVGILIGDIDRSSLNRRRCNYKIKL